VTEEALSHWRFCAKRRKEEERAIPLLPLWAFMACSRVNATFTFTKIKFSKIFSSNKQEG